MEAKIESTEDKIIYATIKLLNEKGLSNTTTHRIASESGFSEVTLFRKFKNKDNFFKVAKETYYSSFFEKIGKIFDYRTDNIKDYITPIWKQIMVLPNNELNMVKIAIDELKDSYSKPNELPKFTDMAINKLFKFFQHPIDNRIHEINPKIVTYNIFCLIFESIIIWKIYGINLNQIAVESSYLNDFRPVYEWNLNWIYS